MRRTLLDQGVRGEEAVVASGELLDELLVLVELLEVINSHGIDAKLLSLGVVSLVTENAQLEALTGRERQTERAVEALVLRRVVVLERWEGRRRFGNEGGGLEGGKLGSSNRRRERKKCPSLSPEHTTNKQTNNTISMNLH